jgi:hypothetical protein
MGLLDDAIREHLELKRLRGADPGEVAREQREALAPVPRDEHAEPDAHSDEVDSSGIDRAANAVEAVRTEDDRTASPSVHRTAGFSSVGEETAELDMRTVLGEEQSASDVEHTPARSSAPGDLDYGG